MNITTYHIITSSERRSTAAVWFPIQTVKTFLVMYCIVIESRRHTDYTMVYNNL